MTSDLQILLPVQSLHLQYIFMQCEEDMLVVMAVPLVPVVAVLGRQKLFLMPPFQRWYISRQLVVLPMYA